MKRFTDIMLLVIQNKHTYRYYHFENHDKDQFKTKEGAIFHIDLEKAYVLHGWFPWKDFKWRNPLSLLLEWAWRSGHRTALLIYPDEKVDEKSGMIEPVSTFDATTDDFMVMTPRGFEGFVESRIPVNYFKKWTTGAGKIAWWVWLLLAILIVVMFYIFVVGGV